ncbi:S-layer homology domain-containing protein [Chengkuizengella sediminis]|uniref:S-layer homology domain-containing protein n=1 Tax=Chengkuizengella sediminis TaxID=1885917 RepID=UPI00138A4A37|nr:S-layer homology domain-containing protein [Chengkuizengella sediminis]NDI34415.1 hypothetical protein [Chengkuizengella sediminis]
MQPSRLIKSDMLTARDNLGVTVANGKIYAIGGYDGDHKLSTVEEYDLHLLRDNAKLSNLTISEGEITPEFAAEIDEYSVEVVNDITSIEVSSTAEDEHATITIDGEEGTNKLMDLLVGVTVIEVEVTAEDGETKKTYTITVTRDAPPISDESTPKPRSNSDSNSNSKVKEKVVNVEIGTVGDSEVISTTPITQISNKDGSIIDDVTLIPERVEDVVDSLNGSNDKTVRIVIPDEEDKVTEVNVTIPASSLSLMENADANFEIYTINTRIIVSNSSLDKFNEDLFFHLIPIKQEDEKKELEDRIKKDEQVLNIANDGEIQVIGRPINIETNMQSRPVTLILPLKNKFLQGVRQNNLDNFVVFIEHSDGSTEMIKGKIVTYHDNELGLQFDIDNFSTFTMLYIEDLTGSHTPYIYGFEDGTFRPDDFITRAQMAAMLSRNLSETFDEDNSLPYQDITQNHWAFEEINILKQQGIMEGYTNGHFGPEDHITRAQMANIIDRWVQNQCEKNTHAYMFCESIDEEFDYTDVTSDYWAYDSILLNKTYGIMTGFHDNSFKSEEKLTRSEAVRILNQLIKRGPLYGIDTSGFTDVHPDHWAFYEIIESTLEHQWELDEEGKEIKKER